jgi:hypothetical protein
MCAQRQQPNIGGRRMAFRKVTYLSPFYGYSTRLIASWCGVTVQTARAYKNGSKRPSRTVMRLFRLHREFKVLGESWGGWAIRDWHCRSRWQRDHTPAAARVLGGDAVRGSPRTQ